VVIAMYGSVFRFRVKPGKDQEVMDLIKEFRANPPDGFVGAATYRLDEGDGAYMTAAAHTSKEAYLENGSRAEQAAWFARFRELLAEDVQWHDGEIVDGEVG
jgi:quinol monooxygenase YgiN